MTNLNIEENDLQGEAPITKEHIQNNQSVRSMLKQRGITPEKLPPEEDIKKVERRVKADEKKLIGKSGKLPSDEWSNHRMAGRLYTVAELREMYRHTHIVAI